MAKTVDAQLLNPFLVATLECLSVMGGLQPARKRLFIKSSPQMHGTFAGVIGLSKGITGSCVVSFPEGLAKQIVSMLLGEDIDKLTRDMVQDGIGEIANMVGGGAKRMLATTNYVFDISTPTVLIGHPIMLYNPPGTISIACEFTCRPDWPETFMIELATRPTEMR